MTIADESIFQGLVCPNCKKNLSQESNQLACVSCHSQFPIQNGIPCFVRVDKDAQLFKEDYFEFWFKRENIHFWHVGRKEIIRQFLAPYLQEHQKRLGSMTGIEIGIGNGNVTTELLKQGLSMQGADLFYSSLEFCRKRLSIPLYQLDIVKLPFENRFDFVAIYDIIEHVKEDEKALENVYRALKPGGLVNITVPSCKALWGAFDTIQHERRYSKKELIEKVERAGFKIRRVSFLMFFLFPLVFIVRKLQNYSKDTKLDHVEEVRVVPVINEILLVIFRFEKFLLNFLDLPIGSSLILVAEKPAH